MAKYKVLVLALSCLNNKIAEGGEIIDEAALDVENIPALIEQGFIELSDDSKSKKSNVDVVSDASNDDSTPKKSK